MNCLKLNADSVVLAQPENKIKSVFKKYELIMSSSLSGKEKENLISYIDRLKNALKGGLENDKTNI